MRSGLEYPTDAYRRIGLVSFVRCFVALIMAPLQLRDYKFCKENGISSQVLYLIGM